ncbi:hypothetical protein GCM10007989_12300 [Devosia pacifica]|uniref:Uncharacterized protein n=1 Tax=Devosia pacifica TaxID=1335967 RepID=A0A918S116_9HYPH|nr:hypothetical protein [Devosia pacifica]GHA18536.1 hypothetical protein GCM10007989_12300 [Devosia pacifica]
MLSTAAVLADCAFYVGERTFRPYARAPWMGTIDDPEIIGHLRELGGDFVCVPFGAGSETPFGPEAWAALMTDAPERPIHGPAGDEDWEVISHTEDSITLGLDYPEDSIVRRLERTVSGTAGAPILESTLTIYPRKAGAISAGLHPILQLPEGRGRLSLEAEFAFGLVHPRQCSNEDAQEFSSLASVPAAGGPIDMSNVPVGVPNFSVQLCGMKGPVRALFLDEGMGVELDWDRELLPSVQLWCTDRGIDGAPWNGEFRGIGVEPIASAFDLNTRLSARPNPINRRGVATALVLDGEAPVRLRHVMTAFAENKGE